jgi:hypothetical protein
MIKRSLFDQRKAEAWMVLIKIYQKLVIKVIIVSQMFLMFMKYICTFPGFGSSGCAQEET